MYVSWTAAASGGIEMVWIGFMFASTRVRTDTLMGWLITWYMFCMYWSIRLHVIRA